MKLRICVINIVQFYSFRCGYVCHRLNCGAVISPAGGNAVRIRGDRFDQKRNISLAPFIHTKKLFYNGGNTNDDSEGRSSYLTGILLGGACFFGYLLSKY